MRIIDKRFARKFRALNNRERDPYDWGVVLAVFIFQPCSIEFIAEILVLQPDFVRRTIEYYENEGLLSRDFISGTYSVADIACQMTMARV